MRWKFFWYLVKINLKITFGLSAWIYFFRKKDRRFWSGLGILSIVLISIAPIFYLYLRLVQETIQSLAGTGLEGVVITSGAILASILVLVLGIAYVISAFYFANDLDFLVTLPFKPAEIMGGKYVGVLVSEYLTIAPFFIPPVVIYGLNVSGGLFYWVFSLLIFLFLPVIPLVFASLGVMVLMSLTNLGRRKDLLRFLGMILILVIVLGANFYLTRLPEGQEMEFIMGIMEDPDGLIAFTGRVYPPSIWITRALAGQTLGMRFVNLLLFSGVSILGFAVLMIGADRLFFRGLIGGQEVSAGKKARPGLLDKKMRARHPIVSIAIREIKILIRVPIYLFNSIFILVIAPIALFFPLLMGTGGVNIDEYIGLVEPELLVLGGIGFFGLMALFGPALSSSISREGKLFRISQVIPVHPNKQILGKMLSGFLISILVIPLIFLAAILYIPWSLGEIILISFLGFLLSFPLMGFSLLVDLIRPYFTWQNPQQAIKQNMNVLFSMVGGFLFLAALGWGGFKMLEIGFNPGWIYFLLGLFSLIIGIFIMIVLFRVAPDRYQKISL